MKRAGVDGGFILCFVLNLVLNAYWALPAVILFIAHFVAGTPIWLGWAALILWIVAIFGLTVFLGWAASSSNSNSAGTGVRGSATIRYSSQQRNQKDDQQR